MQRQFFGLSNGVKIKSVLMFGKRGWIFRIKTTEVKKPERLSSRLPLSG